jgi:hypothetical protein
MIYDELDILTEDTLNKLFCTFTKKDQIDETISRITSTYTVLHSKIFVLEILEEEEYVCTYNIDIDNTQKSKILPSTILMHRRKDSDTLYTINSLNLLIAELNNGVIDKSYKINWSDYKNCILLTRAGQFTKLNTKVSKIVPVK